MSDKKLADRRSFLKLASLSAAGAVASVASSNTARADNVSEDGSKGYSETDHVKKVYELAKF